MRVGRADFAISSDEYRRLTPDEAKRRVPSGCALIPCPGCDGQALLEPPVTVVRDGMSRTFAPATCRGSCKTEKVRYGRTYLVAKKFEIEAPEQSLSEQPIPKKEDFPVSLICERKAVQARIDESGTSLFALASDMRLDLAGLKKWLRNGKGLPTKDVDRLLEWAEPKPEISALPIAALNQIATNDALERAVGLTGDTLPETPARSEKWVEERQLVREAMESRNVSQAGVAQAAGVHSTSLCTWLKRGERIAPDKVERLISWAKSPWDPDPLPPVAECYPVDPTGHNVEAHREWQTSNTQIVVGPPPPHRADSANCASLYPSPADRAGGADCGCPREESRGVSSFVSARTRCAAASPGHRRRARRESVGSRGLGLALA